MTNRRISKLAPLLGLTLTLGGLANTANAQERMGISNSNYAGTNGVWLNPSSIVDSRVFLDIHLAGFGVFAHNNGVYLPESRVYDLAKEEKWNTFATTTKDVRRNGFLDASVSGPAATLALGRNGFGLHSAVRSYSTVNNLPDMWADAFVSGYDYNNGWQGAHQWNNVSVKNLSWAEFGGTYSRMFKVDQVHMFNAGISVKRLIGINSTNVSMRDFSLTVANDSNAVFHNLDAEVAYVTQPAWNVGRGWGFDLGFTYKRALNDANYNFYTPHKGDYKCDYMDYKYRIGVSILDIGRIKFDTDAVRYTYLSNFDEEDNTEAIAIPETDNAGDVAQSLLEPDIATTTANEFKAKLPTTVSVQFDYNFENDIYLNATLMQRFNRNQSNGVHRPNILAVTPRYERRNFEAALPISLYEYRYPLGGLTVRYKFLTVGTDNLWPYVFKTDLYRADVYLHVKVPLYRSCNERSPRERTPKTRSKSGSRAKKPKGKPSKRALRRKVTKCPTVK